MYSINVFNKIISNKLTVKILSVIPFKITEQILEKGTKKLSPKYTTFKYPVDDKTGMEYTKLIFRKTLPFFIRVSVNSIDAGLQRHYNMNSDMSCNMIP